MPDITFQYERFEECLEFNNEFNRLKGIYPGDERKRWESLPSLRERVRRAADKYAHYDKAIIVSHGMVMRVLTYAEEIKNGEIIECHYEIGQPDCEYSFS
jgi:broad specificity phosphatase PhoE